MDGRLSQNNQNTHYYAEDYKSGCGECAKRVSQLVADGHKANVYTC